MVLSHPRPGVQSVPTQKPAGFNLKWMFISVKPRDLGGLGSVVCVWLELELAQAPPLHRSIHTLVSSAASGFWRDLPPLGVFACHQPGCVSAERFYGAAVSERAEPRLAALIL